MDSCFIAIRITVSEFRTRLRLSVTTSRYGFADAGIRDCRLSGQSGPT